jgi:hypothetical protein
MPPMRVFTARDTNVKTMAWAAVQDAAGILYFGCDTVVSFDGDRWFPERMDPTYVVRGLDLGPNGRIWAAGVNQIGWFEAGPPGRLEYHSLMSRLPPGLADLGDVWRVYAEGDAGAVFVTHEKILRWDGNRFSAWEFPGLRMLWSTRTARAVYVHYPPLGLLRVGSEGPSLAVPQSAIGTADIRWLDDSGEDWLLLTSEGFKVLHQGACTLQDTEASRFARANTPTGAVRLADGSLAVGTLKGGIAVGRRNRRRAPAACSTRAAGLPENQVYSSLRRPRRCPLVDGTLPHCPAFGEFGGRPLQRAKRLPAGRR